MANQNAGALEISRTGNKLLMIPLWILALGILILGMFQSGNPVNIVDISGFLFVLAGGIALVMISFPVAEIRRALRIAAGAPANEIDIRASMFLWEAAGRGFLIAGVIRSILHLLIFFGSFGSLQYGTWQLMTTGLSQSLVTALYGFSLAVVCFIFCSRINGKLCTRRVAATGEQTPIAIGRPGWKLGAAFGYVLFLLLLLSCLLRIPGLPISLINFKPAFLVIVGGTIAIALIMRGSDSGLKLSAAFAAIGTIGLLTGSIQIQGHVAGAYAFLLSSSLTALLGMALVGAPFDDRFIRTGQIAAPSVFSRIAWYVFPVLSLIVLIPMAFVLTIPGLG